MHHKVAAHRKPRVDRKELLEFAPAVAAAAMFPVLWVISRRIRRHAHPRPNAGWQQPAPGQPSSFPPLLQTIPVTSQSSSSLLERQLRIAILDPGARERLVAHAMKKTGGSREAAVRRVLDDLHRDNERW